MCAHSFHRLGKTVLRKVILLGFYIIGDQNTGSLFKSRSRLRCLLVITLMSAAAYFIYAIGTSSGGVYSGSSVTQTILYRSYKKQHDTVTQIDWHSNAMIDVNYRKKILLNSFKASYHHKTYPLLHSPRECTSAESDLVAVVSSVPSHFEMRAAIRDTWANSRHVGRTSRVVFLVGQPKQGVGFEEIQSMINCESSMYSDIIQYGFQEEYFNLTIKSVIMLDWATAYCRGTKFLVKVDEDVWVNFKYLESQLMHLTIPEAIVGTLWGEPPKSVVPIRDISHKYYMPEDVYSKSTYPSYTSGTCYCISMDLAAKLLVNCRLQTYLAMEDVYVTGVCADGIPNVTKVNMEGFNSGRVDITGSALCYVITGHHYTDSEFRMIEEKCERLGLEMRNRSPAVFTAYFHG